MRFIRADEASCTQYGRNSTGKEKVAARAPHVESETHTTTMPPQKQKEIRASNAQQKDVSPRKQKKTER